MAWRARVQGWLRADQGSRFRRNIVKVVRANVLAQALPLLAAPLLTRLYAPADFGALALFASALSLALAFATLRLEWSLPNARSASAAAALLVLGAMALIATTLIATVLGWLTHCAWPAPATALGPLWLLLPLAVAGAGCQQLLQAWHVRGADLAAVARAKVSSSVANLALVLLAAPLLVSAPGMAALALAAGVVAGSWAGLGMLWRHSQGLPAALRRVHTRHLAAVCRRFRGEAVWSTLVSLANAASFAIVPLLLLRHFSVAEVGWYALMQRLALAPVALVAAAVSQSFWAEAARLVRSDAAALALLYRRSTRSMLALALPLALLCLAGPWYVGWLFGAEQWAGAGWVLAAITPMLIGQAVASPLSHLVVHRLQHWQALWDLARVLLLAVTIELMGRAGAGLVPTVLAVSLVMAAMYALLVLMNLRALKLTQSRGAER